MTSFISRGKTLFGGVLRHVLKPGVRLLTNDLKIIAFGGISYYLSIILISKT